MPRKQTKRLCRTVLVLTAEQVARLDALADESLDNRSRLVRQAVDEFLIRHDQKAVLDQEGKA